ncbi:hypothetical protein AK88_04535 [Plasmodium fragile]|uniref:Phosphatidylcholine-sterol acyltransferase n=1 Tax=Plasmodium fragile TaxID=5857 RepID=A0A0D9QFR8_PLAFR|nr:uncharacterized protein AK88_04535 [Plasmodium fragile]KJP85828.1 hypothetical protein AK88_04535 [Plasmodium fragile]
MPAPAVVGFTPSIRDVANAFMISPYKIIFMNSEKRGQVNNAPYEVEKELETPPSGLEQEEATVTVVQAEPEGEMPHIHPVLSTRSREERTEGTKNSGKEDGKKKEDGKQNEKKEEATKTGVATEDNIEKVAAATGEAEASEHVTTVQEEETVDEVKGVERVQSMEEVETVEEVAKPSEEPKLLRNKTKAGSDENLAHVGSSKWEKKYRLFWKQHANKNKIKAQKRKESKDESEKKDTNKLPTSILLPGVGGSTLIVDYKNAMIHSCSSDPLNSKPFRIWLSLTRLFSITSNVYCTFDTLRLLYDNEKKIYMNQPGVNITVEDYGRLKGIEYLDYINNTGIGVTKYYNTIGSHFLSNGYVDGESILGAPYDWRYPLYQQDYNLFKESIEVAYEKRNGIKINLVGHSLGGLFINYFLVHIVDKEWKQKYLNSILYMSSPFKGSVKTIRALLHGNRDFVSFKIQNLIKLSISDTMMKAIGNSVGSLFDLIPYKEYFDHDQVVIIMNTDSAPIDNNYMQTIVTTCGIYNKDCYLNRTDVKLKVYTLSDWHVLLTDDLMEKYNNHKQYKERYFSMDHGVPIYCVYSTLENKSTDYLLFFQSENLKEEPIVYYGIGDGTVPIESLEACNSFYNVKDKRHFEHCSHIGILHRTDAVKYVYDSLHTVEGDVLDAPADVTAKPDVRTDGVQRQGKLQMSLQGINVTGNELRKVPE